jgi:hypothetical protein
MAGRHGETNKIWAKEILHLFLSNASTEVAKCRLTVCKRNSFNIPNPALKRISF